jgi:hypothetical protein
MPRMTPIAIPAFEPGLRVLGFGFLGWELVLVWMLVRGRCCCVVAVEDTVDGVQDAWRISELALFIEECDTNAESG